MMTQTHLLIATALFAKPGQKRRNRAIIAGALIPDASIFILFAYASLTGIPGSTLWNHTYWTEPWQSLGMIGNSAPLYLVFLAISLWLAADFPVHHDDAHIHFWPLSQWRFHSPISYWDVDHYGNIFAIFEALLGIALMALLFRRFKTLWVRICLALGAALYLAVPLFFLLST